MEKLHDKYYGAQDVYTEKVIKGLSNFKHTSAVKETRKVSCMTSQKEFRHTLCPPTKENINEAYTNFRISPSGFVEECALIIGDTLVERRRLFRFLRTEPVFHMMSGDRAVPALGYHASEIHVKTLVDGEFTLEYDVVATENYDRAEEGLVLQEQSVTELLDTKNCVTEISLSTIAHPVVQLFAHISDLENIQEVRLLLDDADYDLVLTKKWNYYLIEFAEGQTINFSRVKKPVIRITTEKPQTAEVNIFCISKNILRKMSGMAGMAYAN